MSALSFPALVGVIGVALTALINRAHWANTTKRWVSLGVTVALVALGIVFHYVPHTAEQVLTAAGVAYTVGQVVFTALKPTGLIDWLTTFTTPAKGALEVSDDVPISHA